MSSPGIGLAAVDWLGQFDLVLDAPAPRVRRVWSLRDRMSACDAAYVAAAEAFGAPLITADERLLRACYEADISAVHLDAFAATTPRPRLAWRSSDSVRGAAAVDRPR